MHAIFLKTVTVSTLKRKHLLFSSSTLFNYCYVNIDNAISDLMLIALMLFYLIKNIISRLKYPLYLHSICVYVVLWKGIKCIRINHKIKETIVLASSHKNHKKKSLDFLY